MTDLIERLLDKQHLRATHGLIGWVLAVESLHSEAADEIKRLTAERDDLRDVLLRSGFVPCDIPACNCGSWHHRYGLPERMQEIKDALAEAGHELSNANGNLPINALKALVAERDELRRQLAEAEQRVPLTDEQVFADDGIMAANARIGIPLSEIMEIVRATERAHGIRSEK